MSERREDLFPELEPPPGGTTRLMARLADEERKWSRRARLWAASGALAVASVAVIVVASPFGRGPRMDPAWLEAPGMASLGLAPEPDAPVSVRAESRGSMVVSRVQVDQPGVVFYRVSAL